MDVFWAACCIDFYIVYDFLQPKESQDGYFDRIFKTICDNAQVCDKVLQLFRITLTNRPHTQSANSIFKITKGDSEQDGNMAYGIDNWSSVQITVKNVHIRYEDVVSNPARPFVLGITLRQFDVYVPA